MMSDAYFINVDAEKRDKKTESGNDEHERVIVYARMVPISGNNQKTDNEGEYAKKGFYEMDYNDFISYYGVIVVCPMSIEDSD